MSAPSIEPSGIATDRILARTRVLTSQERATLRSVAMDSIRHGLDNGTPLSVKTSHFPGALREPGAAFVTLDIEGRLRGCVGSLAAEAPLVVDVARNAYAAAFQDHRFPPLSAGELPKLGLHISLLTTPVPFHVETREELIEALVPGEDGLVMEDPPYRSTFLPQVWESLRDPEDFLSELFRKAGLSPGHWSSTLRFLRYRVMSI